MNENRAMKLKGGELPLHFAATAMLNTTPEQAFEYLDDPKKLSAHMGKSSWMMAGSQMSMEIDQKGGKVIGSEITMKGQMMGIPLSLRETISERVPPKRKAWKTIGPQRLIVIDQYRMGFELERANGGTKLQVFIDYSLPAKGVESLLGRWFSGMYARWCTETMAEDASLHFSATDKK